MMAEASFPDNASFQEDDSIPEVDSFPWKNSSFELDPKIVSVYKSMGIDVFDTESDMMKDLRLDAIFMQGVSELKSEDIFFYFQKYGPYVIDFQSLEWIDDDSCIVTWFDECSCARALLALSKPVPASFPFEDKGPEKPRVWKFPELPIYPRRVKDEKEDVPPEYIPWRLGEPYLRAKTILLRFATKGDKIGSDNIKKMKTINHFKRHREPDDGETSQRVKPSRYLTASLIKDIHKQYTKVMSLEQRQRYVIEYNGEYDEYLIARRFVYENSELFSAIAKKLRAQRVGSPEYVRLVRFLKERKDAADRSGYDDYRMRYEFLRAKFIRIGELVEEFDNSL